MSAAGEQRAGCAHMRVRYVTRPANDPTHPSAVTGQWECDLCSTQFYPRPQVLADAVAQAVKERDDGLAQTFKERDAAWEHNAALREEIARLTAEAIEGGKYKNRYMALMERLDMAARDWGLAIPEGLHPLEWDMVQRIIEHTERRTAEVARLRVALGKMTEQARAIKSLTLNHHVHAAVDYIVALTPP